MATASFPLLLSTTLLLFPTAFATPATTPGPSPPPTPTPWPPQFHSLQYVNTTGNLTVMHLWYDWLKGRNLNTIQHQLGDLVYDLEWTNGTSFYYTLDSSRKCKTLHFGYGILRPNWLEGAEYLGQQMFDGFLCNVWTKVEFIWYYEDVVTKRPVHWLFYTGMSVHVMTFDVGATLEDEKWQAPVYCFDEKKGGDQDMGGEGFGGDHMRFLKKSLVLEGSSDQ